MAVPLPPRTVADDTGASDALYEQHRSLIEDIIRFVCRRRRVRPEEAEEFAARVRLRLVESDYAMLRRFEGRASLRTYLTVVIQRLYLDFRTEQWGRWRPSAVARAAGRDGVRLEQLMIRDGLPFDEAVRTLAAERPGPRDRAALEALSARFPHRARRHFEGEELLESMAAASPSVEELLVRGEEQARFERVRAVITRLVATLSIQDRLVVQLRFEQGLSIANIARTLQLEQKPLYRRLEQVLARLRTALEEQGFSADEVRPLLDADRGASEDDRASMSANRTPAVRLFQEDGPQPLPRGPRD